MAQSVIKAIALGKIEHDDVMPSINEMSFEFDISRDTAEKSYKYLKKLGVLGSVPGKGYYVKTTNVKNDVKVFLLFNKLSAHKKIIYDSFVKALGDNATIDFYIYNNDFNFFKRLLTNAGKHYSHFVIIAHFLESGENAYEILNTIPKEKLVLLDKLVPGVSGDFSAVYENFENDIYSALEDALERLKKYERLKIIVPSYTYFPDEITNGFKRFCHEYAFTASVVNDISKEKMEPGAAYISLMEDDLVTLIEKIKDSKLKIGQDIGVISYNETPLKKLILQGVTTFSTDFEEMGRQAALLILDGARKKSKFLFI
ncbi:substrate-binding domain-containing protein [Niabella ginsengisoli]|uniref:Substrate-binding domain-containing protein n=1 Tax=Niabella ginsengisoli TaxID=522298 RepID=A0ABS9SLR1_9BACT|nr:substrate-binding domain-containing protein [Niabella ginsengisoli]MCH5599282.1 substrate-binding domain-containing protein [Niabella ginsengisoli]